MNYKFTRCNRGNFGNVGEVRIHDFILQITVNKLSYATLTAVA